MACRIGQLDARACDPDWFRHGLGPESGEVLVSETIKACFLAQRVKVRQRQLGKVCWKVGGECATCGHGAGVDPDHSADEFWVPVQGQAYGAIRATVPHKHGIAIQLIHNTGNGVCLVVECPRRAVGVVRVEARQSQGCNWSA